MRFIVLLSCLIIPTLLSAKIWQVGPSRTYVKPSAVAGLVTTGDTVDIDAGEYVGDVAKWFAGNLLLRGVGVGRAHLKANGNYAEGKAIWVIKGADCRVENIEFSGCQVPDHNGAGIRQEGQNLTMVNCSFHHNEMGILTVNDGISNYVFERCEFYENGYGDGYSHNVYVGRVNSLTMRYCYSHDAKVGHLVKSRAQQNLLLYNRFTLENGDGSYEVDLPNGGLAILIGNVIEQAPGSQNGGIVAFALEGATNTQQQLALAHNTILNNRFDGRFVQYGGTPQVKATGNLFLGKGTLIQGSGGVIDTSFNLHLTDTAAAMLTDLPHYLFRPLTGSPCINAGNPNPGTFEAYPLLPQEEYVHPLGHVNRSVNGTAPDIGAQEAAGNTSATSDFPLLKSLIYPNPFQNSFTIQPYSSNTRYELLDNHGKVVDLSINGPDVNTSTLPDGLYWLRYGNRLVPLVKRN